MTTDNIIFTFFGALVSSLVWVTVFITILTERNK